METDRGTELRVLREADWDEWYGSLYRAFGWPAEQPEDRELHRSLLDRTGVWPPGTGTGSSVRRGRSPSG